MRTRCVFPISCIFLSAMLVPRLPAAAVTHDALATALEAQFRPSKGESGAAIFTVQRAGLLGFSGLIIPENKIEEGRVEHSRLALNSNGIDVSVGTRVYISKIEAKNETVKVHIATVDKFGAVVAGINTKTRYKAVLSFRFAKDYLNTAPAGQVAQQISFFLAPDTGAPAQAAPTEAAAAPPPPASPTAPPPPAQAESFAPVTPPPPPAPEAAPPATISIGQTTDQVVAILGPPRKISDVPGKKKLYEYPDLKITFTNGKVSDVR